MHLIGGVYNTVGLNGPDGIGDTSPQEILDRVDVDALPSRVRRHRRVQERSAALVLWTGSRSWSGRSATSTA